MRAHRSARPRAPRHRRPPFGRPTRRARGPARGSAGTRREALAHKRSSSRSVELRAASHPAEQRDSGERQRVGLDDVYAVRRGQQPPRDQLQAGGDTRVDPPGPRWQTGPQRPHTDQSPPGGRDDRTALGRAAEHEGHERARIAARRRSSDRPTPADGRDDRDARGGADEQRDRGNGHDARTTSRQDSHQRRAQMRTRASRRGRRRPSTQRCAERSYDRSRRRWMRRRPDRQAHTVTTPSSEPGRPHRRPDVTTPITPASHPRPRRAMPARPVAAAPARNNTTGTVGHGARTTTSNVNDTGIAECDAHRTAIRRPAATMPTTIATAAARSTAPRS